MKMELFDLSILMDELVEYFQILAEAQGVRIISSIERDIHILGNRDQLSELVTNLVSNAFKYVSPSRVDKFLDITLRKSSPTVELIVKDNGIGIEKEYLIKIFDRFYRVKTGEGKGVLGSGIGLSICKKIVEKHNGTIRASSEIGKETTVTVLLPPVVS